MSVIETIILKEDLEMFHDTCPNCKHDFNPSLSIKAGAKLQLNKGFNQNYITLVSEGDGFRGTKTISHLDAVWEKAKELSK